MPIVNLRRTGCHPLGSYRRGRIQALTRRDPPDEEEYDGDVDSEELSDCEEDPQFTLVEIEEDPADDGFIREMYSRGLKELLDWDDVVC